MFVRQLRDDIDGVILPYVAIMLGVIVGLSALALEGGRLMSIQTQLQNGADALALAGAAELDRRPDSIIRAQAAIQNLITNPVSGAGIGQTVRSRKHPIFAIAAIRRCSRFEPQLHRRSHSGGLRRGHRQTRRHPNHFSGFPVCGRSQHWRQCPIDRRIRPNPLRRAAALRLQSVRDLWDELLPGDRGVDCG